MLKKENNIENESENSIKSVNLQLDYDDIPEVMRVNISAILLDNKNNVIGVISPSTIGNNGVISMGERLMKVNFDHISLGVKRIIIAINTNQNHLLNQVKNLTMKVMNNGSIFSYNMSKKDFPVTLISPVEFIREDNHCWSAHPLNIERQLDFDAYINQFC